MKTFPIEDRVEVLWLCVFLRPFRSERQAGAQSRTLKTPAERGMDGGLPVWRAILSCWPRGAAKARRLGVPTMNLDGRLSKKAGQNLDGSGIRSGSFASGEKPRENFLDQGSDRGFWAMAVTYIGSADIANERAGTRPAEASTGTRIYTRFWLVTRFRKCRYCQT